MSTLTGGFGGDIVTTSSDIFLNFTSDETETRTGFKIKYDSGIKIF